MFAKLTTFQISAPGGKAMQISVYRSQNGVRWGRKHPHRPPFCGRYTLICMGLPLEALYLKVVNFKVL